MFEKILIANRGEIACRIIRTCRRLGIATVAVYSEPDANSRHVRLADEAWCIGPAASSESYLGIDRVLDAARRSGAQAIHPGYGFLSENAAFAEACHAANIAFIGPPVEAIRAMGSKAAAKSLMEQAGVPLVPGYHGDRQEPAFLRDQADRIGYPVLIKATAGGGGKGMRVVTVGEEFEAALASCRREARAGFGDDRVLLEKYLLTPRHIEIQVFGDTLGNIVYLHERDCSAQRRHQKVVEEAPAPGIGPARRAAMGKAACDAARAVGYAGAGTVEFIVDASGAFYFMEMNTRLQVEHPVTECITGQDLVEWQLRVAHGEPLPLSQPQIPLQGHAIEARIYAEDPEKGFLPSIGRLAHFVPPAEGNGVRIDTGVGPGDEITPHYDPMVAKLIVHGDTRAHAISRMLRALAEFRIAGVGNNIDFLQRLIDHPQFHAGTIDTGMIERERGVLLAPTEAEMRTAAQAAALWLVRADAAAAPHPGAALEHRSPWSAVDNWGIGGTRPRKLALSRGDAQFSFHVERDGSSLRIDGEAVMQAGGGDDGLSYTMDGRRREAQVYRLGRQLHVFLDGRHYEFATQDPSAAGGDKEAGGGSLAAPMPGKIIALLKNPGDRVDQGAPLLVMEAMKMEHTLCAPAKGTLRAFLCALGQQVADGVQLVDFEKAVS
jgi:3-methylcrotonyl-CoA carboxylase alpha subunit